MTLKNIRVRRHWSQDDLAQASGLNVRTIQRIERNHTAGLESLKSLAAAFDIDIAELRDELAASSRDDESKEAPANTLLYAISLSAFLIAMLAFPLMSAIQDPSNWAAFAMICFCYLLILGGLGCAIFGSSVKDKIMNWL